jgi:acetylornithine deacetylase
MSTASPAQSVPEHKARVYRRIEAQQEELIAFLRQYVSMPSVNPGRATPGETGDEAPCQHWLAERLRAFGTFAAVDVWDGAPGRPNVAAMLRGATRRPGLMFNGHTDTVEVTPDQRAAWSGDPWSGEIRAGRLYGRGATDMKAGNAAFFWAAKAVAEAGVPLVRDVFLTANIAEETAEAAIGPQSVLARGYTAPLIVNAEPTNLRVCPATMGWFFFRLSVAGKSLHPASRYTAIYPRADTAPLAGVDAINKMRKLMDALTALEQDWALYQKHPVMPPGGMNLCPVYIQGGSHRAAMSESCAVEYAVVFNPALRSAEVLRQIKAALDGVSACDTWLREHPPTVEAPIIHQILEPVNLPLDHPGVRALAAAYADALGHEPAFGCLPGPCDANIMSEAGATTVICGPGDLSWGAHGTNEYVPIDQVIAACKVYAGLIVDLCGPTVPERT